MLQNPTYTFCYLYCVLKFLLKANQLFFIFFSYSIILFGRTNFKKEIKHGYYYVQGRKPQNWNLNQAGSCIQCMQGKPPTMHSHTDMQKNPHKRVQL